MRKAVVLGGYGLIGAACMRALTAEGFAVTGIGRSRAVALASSPDATWVIRDIRAIDVAEWQALLADADIALEKSAKGPLFRLTFPLGRSGRGLDGRRAAACYLRT